MSRIDPIETIKVSHKNVLRGFTHVRQMKFTDIQIHAKRKYEED